MEQGGSRYLVLIDTGNEAGWIVCNSKLRRRLVSRRGANLPVESGAADRSLTGYRIVTDSLNLGGVVLRNAIGVSFQKLDSDSYDANLNPFFIRNRVVTVDYVSRKLILRTKERFESDLSGDSSAVIRLPCYGHKWPYIPVTVDDSIPAVALIETGAGDFEFSSEFVSNHKTLAGMSGSREYDSPSHDSRLLSIRAGGMMFDATQAMVRPAGFGDALTGLSYDLMIGSNVFDRRLSVSFDPNDRTVILQALSGAGATR